VPVYLCKRERGREREHAGEGEKVGEKREREDRDRERERNCVCSCPVCRVGVLDIFVIACCWAAMGWLRLVGSIKI